MSITVEFSPYWKDSDSLLMYKSPDFQFRSSVVITEFEDCLIKKISTMKLYHAIGPKDIATYDEQFIKKIRLESTELSIIIISNQIGNSKIAIDAIKRKLEAFIAANKFPILALFALKPNRLSKPHTGMWRLLDMYYKSVGQTVIQKACIVSNLGGRILEHELKSGTLRTNFDRSDTDRAFAANIGVPYYTIAEYLGEKKEKFSWNKKCLAPDIRDLYVQKLSEYKNPNIFAKLAESGVGNAYMLMIYGAPRSGKTTLAKHLIKKWEQSEHGKTNVIKRLGRDQFTKQKRISLARKYLGNRVNVIIDGECHSDTLREPFLVIAAELNIPVLHVEVNPGIGIAYIFNHVAVELADNENVVLYPDRDYHYYKSTETRPKNVVLYCPVIKKIPEVMQYYY